jgi:hypothetical protein
MTYDPRNCLDCTSVSPCEAREAAKQAADPPPSVDDVLQQAAAICDKVALGRADNRFANKPRAAYQAAAAKCAWEVRQLAKRLREAKTKP